MKRQNLKMIGLLYVTYLVFYLPRKADSVVKSSLQRELGFTLDQRVRPALLRSPLSSPGSRAMSARPSGWGTTTACIFWYTRLH